MRIESAPKVYLQCECPLCHSRDLSPIKTEQNLFPDGVRSEVAIFNKTWVQLAKCQDCGFCFTKEIPSDPNFFTARYDIEFDPAGESKSNFKEHILTQAFNLLKKYNRIDGKLLDIGSFAGILMRLAQKNGFEASGVEVNPTMANYTKDELKLDVYNGTFLNYPCEDETFDVITLIDVLEHLLEPREMLDKCYRVLKPGGHIIIKVPNCHPQIFKQNLANRMGISKLGMFSGFGHINHFSQSSLNSVLSKIGFSPLECIVAESENWANTGMKSFIKNTFRKCVYHLVELFRKCTGINYGLNICTIAVKEKK